MTKLIAILAVLLVIWGGWKLFEYWESVNAKEAKAATVAKVVPEGLLELVDATADHDSLDLTELVGEQPRVRDHA